MRWLIDDAGEIDDLHADSASITLTACDENGMAGFFQANFGGGDTITGSFNVAFAAGYGFDPPEGEEDEEP